MPTKKTDAGREYDIDGKKFIWHPLDDNDEAGNLPDVVLPMRIKLKVIRGMGDRDLDTDAMFDIIDRMAPDQGETLDEMDIHDFSAMFAAWQVEYELLSGASLGE